MDIHRKKIYFGQSTLLMNAKYIYICLYKYWYASTSKLKITIIRHQKILTAPGSNKKNVKITKSLCKYNKAKNSERINEELLLQ